MSTVNPDEINPFQAPRSAIGTPTVEADADAEVIRRTYIRHEASVRSIGMLAYLGRRGSSSGRSESSSRPSRRSRASPPSR